MECFIFGMILKSSERTVTCFSPACMSYRPCLAWVMNKLEERGVLNDPAFEVYGYMLATIPMEYLDQYNDLRPLLVEDELILGPGRKLSGPSAQIILQIDQLALRAFDVHWPIPCMLPEAYLCQPAQNG